MNVILKKKKDKIFYQCLNLLTFIKLLNKAFKKKIIVKKFTKSSNKFKKCTNNIQKISTNLKGNFFRKKKIIKSRLKKKIFFYFLR